MRLNLKQLKSLLVETAGGIKLGRIHDVIFETEGQIVAQYLVKPSLISGKKFLINREQVVRFEQDKMVVEDSAVKEVAAEKKQRKIAVEPEPFGVAQDKVVMRGR